MVFRWSVEVLTVFKILNRIGSTLVPIKMVYLNTLVILSTVNSIKLQGEDRSVVHRSYCTQ